MAGEENAQAENAQASAGIAERFPALKQLEEDTERAKLEQARAEARAATVKAKLSNVDADRAKLDQAVVEAQAATAKALTPKLDVELARDTVAFTDKTTGLARVLVQMDTVALADDVAEFALDAARADSIASGDSTAYSILVVTNPSVLTGVDVYWLLKGQLDHLRSQIEDYAPAPKKAPKISEPPGEAIAAALSGAIGLGVQAIGLASKLFARDYHISGREVPVDDLGFDLELAHYLRAKKGDDETVSVEVERLAPTPGSSEIVSALWNLVLAGEKRLRPVVVTRAGALAAARTRVETVRASITALNTEIVELTKRLPEKGTSALAKPLSELTERRKTLEDDLPALEATLADARSTYERGTALLADIDEFVTIAFTPPPAGGRPPALEAARVEDLVVGSGERKGRYLLYARLVAGGLDQVIETKLGPDHFRALAGVTVEFALLSSEGRLLASGVRSALQSSTQKLSDPDSFRQDRPNYIGRDRASVE